MPSACHGLKWAALEGIYDGGGEKERVAVSVLSAQ